MIDNSSTDNSSISILLGKFDTSSKKVIQMTKAHFFDENQQKKMSNKYTYTCSILCSGLILSVCGVIILRALGFDVQWRTAREIQFLFFRGLFLVLAGFSFFGGGDWALGNNAMKS